MKSRKTESEPKTMMYPPQRGSSRDLCDPWGRPLGVLPSLTTEARLRRATVLAVIVALHVLLAMLLANAVTRFAQPQTVVPLEVSLVGESGPPPSPPDIPSPDLRQLAQVQVTVPELMLDLPVEAPPISAVVDEPVRSNIESPSASSVSAAVGESARTGIELLTSLAISAYYPSQSLKLKEQGIVTNAFCVDARGKVTSVRLDRSSGHKRLDDAALRVTRDTRWKAGTLDGRPVSSCALHTLRFFLAGK